jgi:hypothetical protein
VSPSVAHWQVRVEDLCPQDVGAAGEVSWEQEWPGQGSRKSRIV